MNFSSLSSYFSNLEKTASRNQMMEILADLFEKASVNEIDKICYLLQGRVAPLFEPVEFGMADKMMIRALANTFNENVETIQNHFKKVGDLGIVAYELAKKNNKCKFDINEVYEKLWEVATNNGAGSVDRKIYLLSELFRGLDAESCRFVTRIPLGKLRLGFSDMTILDALSWMLFKSKTKRSEIESAYNVRPDLGFIAKTIKGKGMAGLKHLQPSVGTPILMARAERLTGGQEIVEKIGKCAIEYKYDGFRLQIHFSRKKDFVEKQNAEKEQKLELFQDDKQDYFIRVFTRNLENVTEIYPDVVRGVVDQIDAEEAIFEGEAIAFNPKTKEFLPFQETVQRKRKYDIAAKSEEIPLKLVAFEVLYQDGESFLETPYEERRKKLEKLFKNVDLKKTVMLSEIKVMDNGIEIEKLFEKAVGAGLEGIMAKKLTGSYQAGARGWNWIKYKRSYSSKLEDTIDAVVMGYDVGQGKRQDFGIGDFLIGIYQKKDDTFQTVAKIGTGLTDEEWRALKKNCDKYKNSQKPKRYVVDKAMDCDVWVDPQIVVEINADEITRSPVHTAGRVLGKSPSGSAEEVKVPGYALRFPRLKTFRAKNPEDATSLKEIEEIYNRQVK